jgi:hypothetical protein
MSLSNNTPCAKPLVGYLAKKFFLFAPNLLLQAGVLLLYAVVAVVTQQILPVVQNGATIAEENSFFTMQKN